MKMLVFGRHSLGGSDGTFGYIWMDWRCSDGLEVMMGFVMIDISIEPLYQIFHMCSASDDDFLLEFDA